MFFQPLLDSSAIASQSEANLYTDIYHLAAYHRIETVLHSGTPYIWQYSCDEISLQIPLLHSGTQESNYPRNLLSPYGYPGIIHLSGIPSNWLSLFLCYHREVMEAGFRYTFLRFHPFYNHPILSSFPGFLFQPRGATVAVNLHLPHTTLFNDFSENHRRNLRKTAQNQFTCLTNARQYLPQFYEAYIQTMNRRKAAPKYFLPITYFSSLLDELAPYVYFIVVVDRNEEFASGGLFSFYKEIGQYLYGATNVDYLRNSPAKLMINQAIILGQQLKCHWLHLGGGYGSSNTDGLSRFKRGFSPVKWQYHTLEIFHSQFEEYLQANPQIKVMADCL